MNISKVFIIILLASFSKVQAQTDSLSSSKKKFVPDYAKLQFAGEIGFLSPGVGYELFKNNNGELDFFIGFLPEEIGGDNIVTIAVKFHYIPWKIDVIDHRNKLEPLTLGALVYHALGEDMKKASNRDLYPNGYYSWSIRTRLGPFFGSRITREFGEESAIKSITFYCEIGTNDLFLYSWAKNRTTVPLSQIWNSSFGLKFKF